MASNQRLELVSYPSWSREIEKWSLNQIRKNIWRFDTSEDEDDLLQDARILFFKLERKYPTVTDAPHFFTLYKTSLKRMFIDKARGQRRKLRDVVPLDEMHENALPQVTSSPLLGIILEELPEELKLALRDLTSGRVRLKLNMPRRKCRSVRENFNMRLKRRGITLHNPTSALKAHLANV